MSSHDTRVVEMRFDNAQFEKGIKESMKTLDEFEKSLKLDKAVSSLSKIEEAANKFTLKNISNAVTDGVRSFGILGVAGVTAISNITTAAMAAGSQIVSGFIQPMQMGFKEYETQINAVQTILTNTSSKGTTIDDVNKALDELNVYADKTIYNFTQMTDNIGRFTAAGVGLEDSVTAIKGISNLAAASGADSAQAARAMYNLSQAISMGKLQLMDWNSVVNAGMGGELFQESLKETARVHGVAVDEIIAKNGSFRDSLSEGWITSEILLETLSKFTGDLTEDQLKSLGYTEQQIKGIMDLGTMANDAATKVKTYTQLMDTLKEEDQSGWTQSWEIIIGDYEEAKELWSDIARITTGVISEQSQARNSFLESVFGGPSGLITADRWIEFMRDGKAAENSAFFDALQKTVEKSGISIDDLREKYGSFMAAVASGEVVTEKMVEDTINGVTQTSTQSLDQIKEIVDQIENGFFGNGEERRKALEEAGYSYEALQALVDADWNGYGFGNLDWENLTEDQLRNLGVTEDQIVAFEELKKQMGVKGSDVDNLLGGSGLTGREMLVNSITNVIQAGADALHLFGEVWNEVFPPAGPEGIKNALEAVMNFTEQFQLFTRVYDEETGELKSMELTKFGEKVKTIFTGIADGFGIIFDAIGAAADFIKGILESIFGDVFANFEGKNPIDFLVECAEAISGIRDDLQSGEFIPKLIDRIKDALTKLSGVGEKVKSVLTGLFSDGNGGISVQKIGGAIGLLLNVMRMFGIGSGGGGSGSIGSIGGIRKFGVGGLALGLAGIVGVPLLQMLFGGEMDEDDPLYPLKQKFDEIANSETIKQVKETFSGIIKSLGLEDFHPFEAIKTAFEESGIDGVVETIGSFFSGIGENVGNFFSGIWDSISSWVNGEGLDPIGWISEKIDAIKQWGDENGIDLSFLVTIKDNVVTFFTDIWSSVSNWMSELDPIGWIDEKIGIVKQWGEENGIDLSFLTVVSSALTEFKNNLPEINFGEGFDPIGTVQTAVGGFIDWAADKTSPDTGFIGNIISVVSGAVTDLSGIVIGSAMDAITWIQNKIGAFIRWATGKEAPDTNFMTEIVTNAQQAITDLTGITFDENFDPIASIKQTWSDVRTWFQTFIDESVIVQSAIDLVVMFRDFLIDVANGFFDSTGEENSDGVSGPVDKMATSVEELAEKEPAFEKVKEIFGAIGDFLGELASMITPEGVVEFLKDIPSIIGELAAAFTTVNISIFLRDLGEGLSTFADKLKGVKEKSFSTKLLEIAGALTLIVVAISGASKIENPQKAVIPLVEAVSALLGALAGDSLIAKHIGTGSGMDWKGLLALAYGVKILVDVVQDIVESGLNLFDVFKAGVIVSALMTMLGLDSALSKLGKSGGFGTAATILALVFGIRAMLDIVKEVNEEGLTFAGVSEAMKIVGAVGLGLSVFAAIVNASNFRGGFFAGIGSMFAINALVHGIDSLIDVVVEVAKFSAISEVNADSLTAATGVVSVIGVVLSAMESLMMYVGEQGAKTGGFLGMVGGAAGAVSGSYGISLITDGLSAMVTSIAKLSKQPVDQIEAAGETAHALANILGAFETLFSAIAAKMGPGADFGALAGSFGEMVSSLGLAVLVESIADLAKYPADQIEAAGESVGAISAILGLFTTLFEAVGALAGPMGSLGAIAGGVSLFLVSTGISNLVSAIADGLTKLAELDTDGATRAGEALNSLVETIDAFEIGKSTGEYSVGFIEGIFAGVGNWIGEIAGFIAEQGKELGGALWESIVEVVNSAAHVLGFGDVLTVPVEVGADPEKVSFELDNQTYEAEMRTGTVVVTTLPSGSKIGLRFDNDGTVQVAYEENISDLVAEAQAKGYRLEQANSVKVTAIVPEAEVEIEPESVEPKMTTLSTQYFDDERRTLEVEVPEGTVYAKVTIPINGKAVEYVFGDDLSLTEFDPDSLSLNGPNGRLNINPTADVGSNYTITLNPEVEIDSTSTEGSGEGLVEGVEAGANAAAWNLNQMADNALTAVNSVFQINSPSKIMIPSGQSVAEGIAFGINQGGSYLIDAFSKMVSASITFLAQFPPQFQQHGLDVTSNIAWGINIGGGTIASALYNMHSSMLIVLGNLSSGFREAGENFTAGLAIGIRSGTSMAIDAAAHVATMALNTAKNTLQEKSPSQATRLMGRFFSQGLGLGVRDDEKFAVGSAQHLGNSMINAMRTTARLVDAVMNDELNMTPTISPIIDMSNLQNANDLMNGAFRSRSVALAYNASMTTDGLVNPFDRLIERLDAKNDFGNTSIYMDGAVLNDDEEMRAVTLDFLYGLKRKAAL